MNVTQAAQYVAKAPPTRGALFVWMGWAVAGGGAPLACDGGGKAPSDASPGGGRAGGS